VKDLDSKQKQLTALGKNFEGFKKYLLDNK